MRSIGACALFLTVFSLTARSDTIGLYNDTYGTNATWISDTEPFENPGNSQTGKSIGYGVCIAGPRAILVLTINYFVQGSSPPCCQYPLLPVPWAGGQVRLIDCDYNTLTAEGLVSTINGNGTCSCG